MDIGLISKGIGGLLCIVAAILFIARIAQSYLIANKSSFFCNAEIKILEKKILDNKRSLIRFHDTTYSYLILLGGQNEHLLDKQPLKETKKDETSH